MDAEFRWGLVEDYVSSSPKICRLWFYRASERHISGQRKYRKRLSAIFCVCREELNKPIVKDKGTIHLRIEQWKLVTSSSRKVWIFQDQLSLSEFPKSTNWRVILEFWKTIPNEKWSGKYSAFCNILEHLDYHKTFNFLEEFCPNVPHDHEFLTCLRIEIQKKDLLQQQTFFTFEDSLVRLINRFHLNSDALDKILGLRLPGCPNKIDNIGTRKVFWSSGQNLILKTVHISQEHKSQEFILVGIADIDYFETFWVACYFGSNKGCKIQWIRKIETWIHCTISYHRNVQIYAKENLVFVPGCKNLPFQFYDLFTGTQIAMRQVNLLYQSNDPKVKWTVFVTEIHRLANHEISLIREILLFSIPDVLIRLIVEYHGDNRFSIGQEILGSKDNIADTQVNNVICYVGEEYIRPNITDSKASFCHLGNQRVHVPGQLFAYCMGRKLALFLETDILRLYSLETEQTQEMNLKDIFENTLHLADTDICFPSSSALRFLHFLHYSEVENMALISIHRSVVGWLDLSHARLKHLCYSSTLDTRPLTRKFYWVDEMCLTIYFLQDDSTILVFKLTEVQATVIGTARSTTRVGRHQIAFVTDSLESSQK